MSRFTYLVLSLGLVSSPRHQKDLDVIVISWPYVINFENKGKESHKKSTTFQTKGRKTCALTWVNREMKLGKDTRACRPFLSTRIFLKGDCRRAGSESGVLTRLIVSIYNIKF